MASLSPGNSSVSSNSNNKELQSLSDRVLHIYERAESGLLRVDGSTAAEMAVVEALCGMMLNRESKKEEEEEEEEEREAQV